ncbi:MAG TPA: tetratricopeptide repeat protein [Rhizomicrobium sp.]|jgi:lipoprotein NlpI
MRYPILGLSLAVILLGGGHSAFAGSAVAFTTALNNCQNESLDIDVRIGACTEIIRTNLLPKRSLADMYFIRGNIYAKNNKSDEALADYNKALELKPDFPEAQNNRAIIQSQSAAGSTAGTP